MLPIPIMAARQRFSKGSDFRLSEWETLAKALQKLAREAEITESATSPHGEKYVIVGKVESPMGEPANVQTIWIVDKGWNVARLVTAYPHKV